MDLRLDDPDPRIRDLAYLLFPEVLLGGEWVERWARERGKGASIVTSERETWPDCISLNLVNLEAHETLETMKSPNRGRRMLPYEDEIRSVEGPGLRVG